MTPLHEKVSQTSLFSVTTQGQRFNNEPNYRDNNGIEETHGWNNNIIQRVTNKVLMNTR
jgi:hypothetical protein